MVTFEQIQEKTFTNQNEPIAIIGIAGIFPGSRTIREFFRNVLLKRCFIRRLPDWMWEAELFFDKDREVPLKTYTLIGALLDDLEFDLTAFRIPPAVSAHMSRNQKLALVCTREALEDAGYLKKDFDREKVGVILAAGTGELREASEEAILTRLIRGRFEKLAMKTDEKKLADLLWNSYEMSYPSRSFTEDTHAGESGYLAAARISAAFDLHGPNVVIDSTCASSLAAVATAVTGLRAKTYDMVIAGGVDTDMSIVSCIGLAKASALSATGLFPFDSRADGFVMGEGCGIIILKRFYDAVRDGDRIYALIRGCGGSSDGSGKGILAPSIDGQLRALRRAYEDAGVTPSSLHYLECHGTGTKVGDATELNAVNSLLSDPAFGKQRQTALPIGSGKAMVGHLKMAAGIVGLIRAVLSINCSVVPPQVNFEEPNTTFDWGQSHLRVPRRPEKIITAETYVGVSGFGFGGTNYHMVLSSSSINARQPIFAMEEFMLPDLPPLHNDIAFMFPGQGSQYVGMLDALCDDPVIHRYLVRADKIVAGISGKVLSNIVCGAQDAEGVSEQCEDKLLATDISQPAIFTASAILLDHVRRLGIEPGMLIGHSLGEYTAIYAAGILSFDETLQAVVTRGYLMDKLASVDSGAMAFVNACPERLGHLIDECKGYIICANLNSYDQTVVSGEAPAVDALLELAHSHGLQARRLDVKGAFHSRFMSPCVETFREFLQKLPFRTTNIPIPANQSRQVYPFTMNARELCMPMNENDRCRTIDLMCQQIDHPVDFVRQIELAYEAGIRRFVEIGPKNVLSGLVRDILQGKPFQTLYLDYNVKKRLSKLCSNLAVPLTIGQRPLSLKPRFVPRADRETSFISAPQNIPDLIRHMVAHVSGYDVSEIGDNDEFERDLGIDTLKIFEIITRLRGKVLPAKFSNFRQATSISKILAFAAKGDAGKEAVAQHESGSQAGLYLRHFRYRTVVSAPIGQIPTTPKSSRYRVILHPSFASYKDIFFASPQLSHRESPDTLILWPLPKNAEELCRETIPALLCRVIESADRAKRLKTESSVHFITLAPPEGFDRACFSALSAFVKSCQWDLSYLRFSYHHIDDLQPNKDLLRQVLSDTILGRRVLKDGQIEEGHLVHMPEIGSSIEELAALLGPEDVVLVTGGARGITASIVRHLLQIVKSRFILIGRKPETEKWIEKEGQGRVDYLTANLCNDEAVSALRLSDFGITLVIHAAGIVISRSIANVRNEELEQVLGTKILGLHNVLACVDLSRLRGIVNFSSTAGFFGARGNIDYAAANGYLNCFEKTSVPVLTIGWSAWDEVGMATRTRPFHELAGIKFIPLQQGIKVFGALLADFLKSKKSVIQNVIVHAGMAETCFLPHDPFRADMIEMKSDATISPEGTSETNDLIYNHVPFQETHQFLDAELEAAVVSLPKDVSFDDADIIVLHSLPVARYGQSRLDNLFTPAELEEIAAVATEKRRQEKLAGKLAVKILAHKVLLDNYGADCEPSGIQVLSSDCPVSVEMPGASGLKTILGNMFFSISHSDGLVCAAVARQRVGIDIEKIRPLAAETAQAICGKSVLAAIERSEQSSQNACSTSFLGKESLPIVVFTQKEAVLKAVGIGLAHGIEDVVLDRFGVGTPVDALYRDNRYRVISVLINGYILSLASLIDLGPDQKTSPTCSLKTVPVSIGQEGMWFQEKLEGIGSTYNVGWSLRLRGPLNVEALIKSLQCIVKRHEALRTVFPDVDGVCEAQVQEEIDIPLTKVDLSNISMEDALGKVYQRSRQEVMQRFDLSRGPLIRSIMFHINPMHHVILFVFHHLIIDASSALAFRKELAQYYSDFSMGRQPSPQSLSFQYGEFMQKQKESLRGVRKAQLIKYWQKKLAGCPELLVLPTDIQRPAVQSYDADSYDFSVPFGLLQALQDMSKTFGVTLFSIFLAAFQTLLMRLSCQDDIVVGSPFVGRNETEMFPLIGYFVNMLPLRSNLSGDPPFREILPHVRNTIMEALEHQDLPFKTMVEELLPRRSAAWSPFFQVVIYLLHEVTEGVSFPGLEQEFNEIPSGGIAYDLSLSIRVRSDGCACRFEYNKKLYTEKTVQLIAQRLLQVLDAVTINPDLHLTEIPILMQTEKNLILKIWNDTSRTVPNRAIHTIFADQAEHTPNSVVLIGKTQRLTYQELNERANKLAHYLKKQGVGPEVLVGVFMERSIDMIVGILGILKAGGAYLPLNVSDPKKRLSFILTDAGVRFLLTQKGLLPRLLHNDIFVFCFRRDEEMIINESTLNPANCTGGDNLAYVMYTSGSTGEPKGVEICHRSIVRLLFGIDYIKIDASQKFLHMAPISFDASTFELWGPLLHGGCCVLFPEETPSIDLLGRALHEHDITTLWLTASLFNIVIDEAPDILSGVKQLLIGGEALSVSHVCRAVALLPETKIVNCYGPTETTTFACCYRIPKTIDENALSIPIGHPIGNTTAFILDERSNLQPIGVSGELYIGGLGVARGYLNRPDLTAAKFIADPFNSEPCACLYRTGDIARYLHDGTLEFLGRHDNQVKIRGYRIELEEIESILRRHPDVREAVVFVKEVQSNYHLFSYVLQQPFTFITTDSLRQFLLKFLPDYMIPTTFITLDAFPLTSSCKIDRQSLYSRSELDLIRELPGVLRIQPKDEIERSLVRTWEELLGVHPISINDNFFDLGGNSLMIIKLFSRIEKEYKKRLSPSVLFQAPTIEKLATFIQDVPTQKTSSFLIAVKSSGSRPPLFCFPNITGSAIVFRHLARYMNQEQPVYSIDGSEEILSSSVEETASLYIKEIRKIFPNGPFFLLGFSSGGVIAFEIARQLHDMNLRVLFLGMLDTYCPIDFKKKMTLSSMDAIGRILKNFPFWLYHCAPFWLNNYVKKIINGTAFKDELMNDVIECLQNYTPGYYQGRLVFFRSRAQGIFPATASKSWSTLAEQVDVHSVPGHHTSILKGYAVRTLAKKIEMELSRSLSKWLT